MRANDSTEPVGSLEVGNDDGSISKPGVLVELDCRMSDFELDKRMAASVFFVVCGSSNTFAFTGDLFCGRPDPKLFVNISNHSSCWKDSIRDHLTSLYFKLAQDINPDKAPAALSQHCWPACAPWAVTCRIKKDSSDSFNYNQMLLEISPR